MPPKSDKKVAKTPAQKAKSADDTMDDDDSVSSLAPKPVKSKTNEDPSQPTLDKHLKSCAAPGELHDILRKVSEKLGSLASQEFIEKKFKQLITEDLLNKKLKEVQKEIKLQVQKGVDSVRQEVKDVTEKVKSMNNIVEELRNKVSDLETKVEFLQDQNTNQTQVSKNLEEKLIEREQKIKSLDKKNNELEQYTRRNSVRIYGLHDEKNESYYGTCKKVQKFVQDRLGITIRNGDVDIAHRLGKYRSDGNRPVICKFVQRFAKQDVVKSRRKLKGTHYIIREDLTAANAKLLEDVSSHPKVKSAWSDEGRIIALLSDNKKFLVSKLSDLETVSLDPTTAVTHF